MLTITSHPYWAYRTCSAVPLVSEPDGSEATASFDVRDEFVVIHGVYKELRLRRGKVVLCIYNESPSFYGRDPKTDTASEAVERTTEN